MSALRIVMSLSLAALLGAGAAVAQNETANPHSTANKDRPAPGAADQAQQEGAEEANPHSTRNKDRTLPADADKSRDLEEAEKDNPHSVKAGDRMKDEGPVTAQAVLDRLATADRGEVAMGKLAQSNGSSRVQQYGQMLEQDHGTALGQVQDLAKKKNVTLGETPKDAMAKHEQKQSHEMHGKLAKLHGAEFDKAFAKAMIDDHKKDIEHLNKWKTAVNDPDVSSLIDQTLPVLQKHLDQAQQLRMPAAQGRAP